MSDIMLAPEIEALIERGDREALRLELEGWHDADLAELIAGRPPTEAWSLLSVLPLDRQAEVFGHFEVPVQIDLARVIGRRQLALIVAHMSSDERADLFNRLSPEQQEALLPALAQAEREDIRRLASYGEGTAGAIMTSDYATLTPELSAREALDKLRREAPAKETIYQSYVVDQRRRLLGSVALEDLIMALPGTTVAELMDAEPVFARVDEDQEEVARKVARYDLIAIPVVDGGDMLVGIVTHDDAMDVAEEEVTEDFQKVGAVGRIEGGVREASLTTLYSKRAPWLVLLVFGNLLSGFGIAYYEETIATYLALVFFLPLLIASAGNAGSQAATLMVRALATGDVVLRDWGLFLGRELAVGLALGLTMALAISGIGLWRGGPDIAFVVAVTMVVVVIVGSVIGMSLPFLLSRLNLDPATASAPLVTSIADAAGVVVYFGFATAFLGLPAS
jgi:magnesium transporter